MAKYKIACNYPVLVEAWESACWETQCGPSHSDNHHVGLHVKLCFGKSFLQTAHAFVLALLDVVCHTVRSLVTFCYTFRVQICVLRCSVLMLIRHSCDDRIICVVRV